MPLFVTRLPLTLIFICLCSASELFAQRLPQTVRPEHYALSISPDLAKATFAGQETIEVQLLESVDSITLNAAELQFVKVTATVGDMILPADITLDPEKQQATFHFSQALPAGKLSLSIGYTGTLNNELRGFYLSKTAKRNYAVSQFESTDARRAFPSFDEPAMKATFSIKLVVDKGDTAISNTNITSDVATPGNPGRHTVSFADTPRMSTYLVALLVGDFRCLKGSSDGIPIRVCATPDQVQYGAYALSAAEYVLHYYDTYFGIKYPMPKLDMIAIPDFEAGAMENFGAITYRESDLLLDTRHASVDAEKNVGLVVAHEMAHQWFGDMVTMQWWDNVWLNEGFASWMENKPIAAWKPEFEIDSAVAVENQGTLDLDAQRVTRTIRAKADTPAEINEMFDGISYGKAGAMLLMVENYVGEETFRQGIHSYLAAHMYGNATAENFWSAQAQVSHKPVDKIMDSLVSQSGVPLITFGAIEGGAVPVKQSRFYLNRQNASDTAQSWTLPICIKSNKSPATAPQCELLMPDTQTLAASGKTFFYPNARGTGYYRYNFPRETYHELEAHIETDFTAEERISLLGNQWALTRAGKSTVGEFLDLVARVNHDTSADVLGSVMDSLNIINSEIASTPEERLQLSAWVRQRFGHVYEGLGDPVGSDTPARKELRANLMTLLGGLGEDPRVIAQAKDIAQMTIMESMKAAANGVAHTAIDATLSTAALDIAARNGDSMLFDQLQAASESSTNPQFRSTALHALASFRDPELEKRALDYAVSSKVRNQDAAGLIASELRRTDTQELAWQYVQANWDKVLAQLTTFGGAYIVGGTSHFCSSNRLQEVAGFFDTHKVVAADRALAISKNQINDCIALRSEQGPSLDAWLNKAR